MKRENKGVLLAVLAAIMSGIAIPANKFFIVNLDASVFTAVRAVIIGVAFLAIAEYLAAKRKRRFRKAPWRYLLAIAVIGGALAFMLYFTGLQLTTAGRVAFLYHGLLAAFPVILAVAFLSERMPRKMVYALIAMFVGTTILYLSQVPPSQLWASPNLGDVLVILATLAWSVEYIIVKKAMAFGENNFVISFARMFFGGLILFGFVVLSGSTGALLSLSLQAWINVLISTALLFAFVLFWYWAIMYINLSKATLLLLLAPVVSLLGGIFFLGEPAPLLQLLGSAIILVSAYFVIGVRSETRKKAQGAGVREPAAEG